VNQRSSASTIPFTPSAATAIAGWAALAEGLEGFRIGCLLHVGYTRGSGLKFCFVEMDDVSPCALSYLSISTIRSEDNWKFFSFKLDPPYPSRQTHSSYVFGSG
jgi:hypothetical protein